METIDSILSRAVSAAARYVADSDCDNTAAFEDSLKALIHHLDGVEPIGRLSISNQFILELLDYSPHILSANTSSAPTRSKLLRLLFNIALYNVRIRRYLCSELHLCESVFDCLKLSLREQLGPQNLIDILRLLQTSYKTFSKRIIKLLSHDSRIVVVSSLVLVGYLEEKVRDMVYCSRNIRETFQCVFNVLIMGDKDCLMTRHIASDFLRRLVVSETNTISPTPVITSTGKDIMNYEFFDRCIQQTAELLIVLDPRMEECIKVYDVLLAFCALPQLNFAVCSAILKCPPTEGRLTTPLLAIASTAATPVEDAIQPEISLKSLRLLIHLVKAKIECGERVSDVISVDQLLTIIDTSVKTTLETSKQHVIYQCRRILEGLRLAEVCSSEEDLRFRLLEVTTAALCAHILESQYITNPVLIFIEKPLSQRTEKIADWSIYGVAVVLVLLKLLASLKDFSKLHKDQYWNSLKDTRLVSFLAYSLVYGDSEMINNALVLYSYCSQLHAFPNRWLCDLMASCSQFKQGQSEAGTTSPYLEEMSEQFSFMTTNCEPMDTRGSSPALLHQKKVSKDDDKALEDLLNKIRNGFNVKDAKISDILHVYEKKILLMERRERELEMLVSAKDQALAQSEKLRIRYRGVSGSNNDVEMTRIRTLVSDCESLREKYEATNKQLEFTQHMLEEKTASMQAELTRVMQQRDDLAFEISQEREVVMTANRLSDDLKKKLEITSSALLERQGDIDILNQEKKQFMESLRETKLEIDNLKQAHTAEVSRLNADISLRNDTIDKLSREAEALQSKLMLKEQECEGFMKELESLRSHGQKTEADLEKMRRLRDEMRKLAEGFD